MLMDARQLSEAIRAKKKQMLTASPEIVGTSPTPDMNAQDVYDLEMNSRAETTMETPERINADDTVMNDTDHGMGVTPEQKKRMGRLRAMLDAKRL